MAERCEVSRQTASSWLHSLVQAGLLDDAEQRSDPRAPTGPRFRPAPGQCCPGQGRSPPRAGWWSPG
ncbi:hypothetical protein [Kineosporia sp. NBRC 101677]|uniref:hypothetical protein n=1 Tax=Kineosporia TaxID=49184 RepID=UPI003319D091